LIRENDQLKMRLGNLETGDPPKIGQVVGGVREALRIWMRRIAPKERVGKGWRTPDRNGLYDSIFKTYAPPLYAVAARFSHGADVWKACEEVEALRTMHTNETGSANWKAFGASCHLSAFVSEKKKWLRVLLDEELERIVKEGDEAAKGAAGASSALQSTANPNIARTLDSLPEGGAGSLPTAQSVSPVRVSMASLDSTRYYLGLDPALSCGYTLLSVNGEQVVGAKVGIIAVDKSLQCSGARCLDLLRQLRLLLEPPPAHVFLESFIGQGRRGDEISYGLRVAIKMELAERAIRYTEVKQQTWKSVVTGTKSASKADTKSAVEKFLGAFPAKIMVGDALKTDLNGDASDAAAIALWGAMSISSSDLQPAADLVVTSPLLALRRALEVTGATVASCASRVAMKRRREDCTSFESTPDVQ
jgi:Holliday junction resolvasome RuvABC endonuclease subunit